MWKKSPDNPMNQAHISFDATKEDVLQAKQTLKDASLDVFKVKE
jgi:hypothetical protein